MKLTQSLAFIITGASFVIPFALAGFVIRIRYSTVENGYDIAELEACGPSKNLGCDCPQQAVSVSYNASGNKMSVDSGLCGMGKLDVYLLPNSSWEIFVNNGNGSSIGMCNTVPGASASTPLLDPVPCLDLLSGVALNVGKLFSCVSNICNAVA